jgi:hypothetical protein
LVPTITLEGDANGAPHPDLKGYARSFRAVRAPYNPWLCRAQSYPEAPQAFAQAVIDVSRI